MMTRSHATLLLTTALLWAAASVGFAQIDLLQTAQEGSEGPMQFESLETSYDQELGIIRTKGDVLISYGGAIIYADEAEYHQHTGDIFARGNVSIFKSGSVFRGAEAVYNVNTGVIVATDLRNGMDPMYYEAGEVTLRTEDTDVVKARDTFITTHDQKNPNYRVKAKRINIYPDEYIVFHSATVYVGDIPVMYFPFYAQPLDDELGFYFTPGYNDSWGGYILTQYGLLLGEHTLATAKLDYRAERGLAGGIDLESMQYRKNENYGEISFYYAQDDNPNLNPSGELRSSDTDSERYRLNVQHRVYIPGQEDNSLYLDVDINKRSDEYFDLDFFQGDFRENPRPDNLVNLVKSHPRGTISLLGRFQLNEFFRTDTRKPELAVDFTRQQIFDTPFFYEGNTSYSILEEKLGTRERLTAENRRALAQDRLDLIGSGAIDPDTSGFDAAEEADLYTELTAFLDESSFNRFHTYHQVLYPTQIGGFLNVVPRAGVGYTRYDEVMGNSTTVDSFDRKLVHAGLDASFKLTKDYGVENSKLGLNQMRHVVQPYAKYSWVATDEADANFPRIDRLTQSTKLRPLDLPLFTATDEINNWNTVRVGTYNRLQTRRNKGTFPWLDVNTYMDFYMQDPEYDRDFSNLFNEMRWMPLPWLSLIVDSQVPIGNGGMEFTENNTYLRFQPARNFDFTIGHYYLDDHPFFVDSSNIRLTTYTRISDNWGFGTAHFFEADDSTLELQQYTLHRDLSSWTAAIGAQIRDNRIQDEFSLVFSLTLKAFPRVGVPVDFIGSNSSSIGF